MSPITARMSLWSMAIACKHCRKKKKEDNGEGKKGRSGEGGRLVGHSTLGVGLDLFILLKLGKRIFILEKVKKNRDYRQVQTIIFIF